jgi:hypothetical protein
MKSVEEGGKEEGRKEEGRPEEGGGRKQYLQPLVRNHR